MKIYLIDIIILRQQRGKKWKMATIPVMLLQNNGMPDQFNHRTDQMALLIISQNRTLVAHGAKTTRIFIDGLSL